MGNVGAINVVLFYFFGIVCGCLSLLILLIRPLIFKYSKTSRVYRIFSLLIAICSIVTVLLVTFVFFLPRQGMGLQPLGEMGIYFIAYVLFLPLSLISLNISDVKGIIQTVLVLVVPVGCMVLGLWAWFDYSVSEFSYPKNIIRSQTIITEHFLLPVVIGLLYRFYFRSIHKQVKSGSESRQPQLANLVTKLAFIYMVLLLGFDDTNSSRIRYLWLPSPSSTSGPITAGGIATTRVLPPLISSDMKQFSMSKEAFKGFQKYLDEDMQRAFAYSESGAWAYEGNASTLRMAISIARERCQMFNHKLEATQPCRLVHTNDTIMELESNN